MKNTLFLTKLEQAAMVAVMGDFDRARQKVQEAQKVAEDVIGEVVSAHKAPPLAAGSTVQMTVVDGRPALIYESAPPPTTVAEAASSEAVPVNQNRVAEVIAAAAAPGNGPKE